MKTKTELLIRVIDNYTQGYIDVGFKKVNNIYSIDYYNGYDWFHTEQSYATVNALNQAILKLKELGLQTQNLIPV